MPPGEPERRGQRALRCRDGSPRPRRWRAVALIAGALLAGEWLLAAGGRIDVMDERAGLGSRVNWARACAGAPPRPDRQPLHTCVRILGRVLYTRSQRLSGGGTETHLLVVADMHLLLVKLDEGLRVPSIGARIDAVGPMVRARNGLREVEAVTL